MSRTFFTPPRNKTEVSEEPSLERLCVEPLRHQNHAQKFQRCIKHASARTACWGINYGLFHVIPEGVGVSSRDPPPRKHRRPRFPGGAFEEQRTSQSELLMSAIRAGGGLPRAAGVRVRMLAGGFYGRANIHERP